jgi:hypothetical protein
VREPHEPVRLPRSDVDDAALLADGQPVERRDERLDRLLRAAVSRSNMLMFPLMALTLLPPKPSLVRPGIQFSWGRFSSLVSSMLTIFI